MAPAERSLGEEKVDGRDRAPLRAVVMPRYALFRPKHLPVPPALRMRLEAERLDELLRARMHYFLSSSFTSRSGSCDSGLKSCTSL